MQPAPEKITAHAYAKINWDLYILGRRPDGFHELDTVMVSVSLHDVLEFEHSNEIALTCSDPTLPVDDKNLVVRAAKLLAKSSGYTGGARIKLTKNIPAGGGMGGGSSDAACTLRSLNTLWGLQWNTPQLQGLAAELGSDVAFFLYGGWARCRGRGEIVEKLPISDHNICLFVLLPPWPVATPSVYKRLNFPLWDGKSKLRNLTEVSATIESALNFVQTGKFPEMGLSNELTDPALQVEPRLANLQRVLDKLFPGRWLMSGSGSVHFVVPNGSETEANLRETLTRDLGVGIRVLTATTYSSS